MNDLVQTELNFEIPELADAITLDLARAPFCAEIQVVGRDNAIIGVRGSRTALATFVGALRSASRISGTLASSLYAAVQYAPRAESAS
jgi:hypothetical protein